MQPSLQLLHLVKSLDVSAVRYFRAYAKRKVSEGTAALQLFDLILRRRKYDEDSLAKAVKVSNFPALKVYLRDMIADSILEQQMKRKGAGEIVALCGQIEIFQKSEFMQLMWLKMDRALELCERYEDFHTWRELLYKKQTILMRDAGVGYTPPEMEGFDEKYAMVWEKFKNLDAYFELEEKITLASRRGYNAMYETAIELSNHPLMRDDAPLLSVRAEIKYCFIKRNIFRWLNQPSESLKYAERVVEILDTNPRFMADENLYQMYASRLYNIGWYAAAAGKIEVANQTIERLVALNSYPVFIFERLHSIELRIAMQELNLELGEKIIAKIEAGMKAHEFKLSRDRQMAYCFQVAHFYIYFSEPKKALRWIKLMRETDLVISKKDIQDFAEILHLVCHYDLGNYDFLKTEANKVIGYLRKRSALSPYEEAIAKNLRSIGMSRTAKTRIERLLAFRDEVAKFKKQPQYEYKTYYFQFDLWIEAKLHGGNAAQYMTKLANGIS